MNKKSLMIIFSLLEIENNKIKNYYKNSGLKLKA